MKRLGIVLLLVLASTPAWSWNLWGVDVSGVEVQSSLWLIQNAVTDGAPSPIVNTIGLSIPLRFLKTWVFRPEVQAFTLGYAYEDGRAVPESDNLFDNVTILGLMINSVGGYEWRLSQTLVWTNEVGLGFLARIPIYFNGSTAADMAIPATAWLLAGRLIYPNLGTSLAWQFSPLFTAVVRAQLFYPIFDLWGGLPWYDQLTLGGGIGIRYSF